MPRARRRNVDVGLRKLQRSAVQGDVQAEDALIATWLRLGHCPDFAARVFTQAFEAWADPPTPPPDLPSMAAEREERIYRGVRGLRYWRLAMHPNRIPYENLGVSWPLGEALTPTGTRPTFACRTSVMPRGEGLKYARLEDAGRQEYLAHHEPGVQVLELEATLQDVIASYDERTWGRDGMHTYTLGLGRWHLLSFRLRVALSELFYETKGIRPLSGWSYDSPFLIDMVRGDGPVEVQELPMYRIERTGVASEAGKHQALTYPVTIRLSHSLDPVVRITTPQPTHPGLSLVVTIPNPFRRAVLEAALSI